MDGKIVDFVSISHALVVADHLSFGRAAQILGVRQSAVNRRGPGADQPFGLEGLDIGVAQMFGFGVEQVSMRSTQTIGFSARFQPSNSACL